MWTHTSNVWAEHSVEMQKAFKEFSAFSVTVHLSPLIIPTHRNSSHMVKRHCRSLTNAATPDRASVAHVGPLTHSRMKPWLKHQRLQWQVRWSCLHVEHASTKWNFSASSNQQKGCSQLHIVFYCLYLLLRDFIQAMNCHEPGHHPGKLGELWRRYFTNVFLTN